MKFVDEICKFEVVLIVKWEWIFFGEVVVFDRFMNFFFEEDLDFEYGGKFVFVIIFEIIEDIEVMIKCCIFV